MGTSDLASYPLESRGSIGTGLRAGRSKLRSNNKSQGGWQDRDSLDNSSQNTILRQQLSSQDYISDGYKHGKIPIQGILTTTEVEIHSSDATDVEVEREVRKKTGGKW